MTSAATIAAITGCAGFAGLLFLAVLYYLDGKGKK